MQVVEIDAKTAWVESGGGPLICGGLSAAASWRGTAGSSLGESRSDYLRACDVDGFVAVVSSGISRVLVLGDEPLRSALVRQSDSIVVVRWVAATSEGIAQRAIGNLPATLPALAPPIQFTLEESELSLFDAAFDVLDVSKLSKIAVFPGLFAVTSEDYKRPGEFDFVVHRFVRCHGH